MLKSCNILLIKKNNFNIYKDITVYKISEMVQVVNLDFQNESDPLNVSYQYINKLMMPMLGLYRNDFEKKSTSDKNSFTNIMRKVNEVPSLFYLVKLQFCPMPRNGDCSLSQDYPASQNQDYRFEQINWEISQWPRTYHTGIGRILRRGCRQMESRYWLPPENPVRLNELHFPPIKDLLELLCQFVETPVDSSTEWGG